MVELLKLAGMYIGIFLVLGYCLAMLIVLVIAAFYSVGYLYDSVCGNSVYNIGIYIAKKYPQIKKSMILRKIKSIIEPKERFTRYETPLCTYCFSYTALLLIYMVYETMGIGCGAILAFFSYILIYFIGMYRRYKENERYDAVLENNLEFLKLSFVPLAFLVTIVGFAFTVSGFNLQQVDWEYFMPIISSVQEKGFFSGLADEIWLVLKLGFMLLVAFYIVSIPMQLVSYYIILVIRYFKNYGQGYRKIVNFFLKTWRNFS